MKIARTIAELKHEVSLAIDQGQTIGLVPTMGALHAGHKSLVDRAVRENDLVIVSVFVNPTQFNNSDDLAKYPRTEAEDIALLEKAGATLAFIPDVKEVYGDKLDDRVFDLGQVATVMEGAMRPGHFNGVAQIVSRLFEWSRPTRAYFGEKDFQQIAVIRQMAKTEGFDSIDIVACPIVRECDGLALSSRNVRLDDKMRALAPQIYATLKKSVEKFNDGKDLNTVKNFVIDSLNDIENVQVEYYSIVDGNSLMEIADWTDSENIVGCITVYFGDVRLIDNIRYK